MLFAAAPGRYFSGLVLVQARCWQEYLRCWQDAGLRLCCSAARNGTAALLSYKACRASACTGTTAAGSPSAVTRGLCRMVGCRTAGRSCSPVAFWLGRQRSTLSAECRERLRLCLPARAAISLGFGQDLGQGFGSSATTSTQDEGEGYLTGI